MTVLPVDGAVEVTDEHVDEAWDPWTPWQVAARLESFDAPWCVTAGWAVNLAAGRTTRSHKDLEIAVPPQAWPALVEALPEMRWAVPGPGSLRPVDEQSLAERHQTWAYDSAFRVDAFRDPHEGATWICNRDARIRRPYVELVLLTPDGVPYTAPEVVLLFKAKHDREKDRTDLAVLLPLLDAQQREWLIASLALVHPGHPWLERVTS